MLELLSPPVTLPGAEIRIVAAVAFTAVAAYYDLFNKKWVPNHLLYGFVLAAVALNIIFFTPSIFAQALLFGAAVFLLTYPLYRIGQLGGADAYVMASIAMAVPWLPSSLLSGPQNVPYPFILSIMVPTGLAFMLHMLARFIPYISRRLAHGQVEFSIWKVAGPLLLLAAFAIFFSAISALPFAMPASYLTVIFFLMLALLFFTLFKDEIKGSMVGQVSVLRLQEEDVLALECMDAALVRKLKLGPLLSAKSIAALKKSGLKKVPVYTGMPFFLPYVLFGLVFSVLFGDLVFYLIG